VLRNEHIDKISTKSGKKPVFGYIKEDLLTLHMSMLMKKHSPFNKIFNIKIDQLIQSGIVQKFVKIQYANATKIAIKEKEEEKLQNPEKLTMEHLTLCFYAVLIGLALSCVVFVFEVLIGCFSGR
jgi:hypothetical protein